MKRIIFAFMGFKHYFSRNEDKRAKFIFNLIAPLYYLIDGGSQKNYKEMAALLNNQVPLKGKDVLDVGCGTGSWITMLANYNLHKAIGSDFSQKMLQQATKNNKKLDCILQKDSSLSIFPDKSFHIVTATFVLHGMKSAKRLEFLKEMKRLAKDYVVIHDFYRGSPPLVRLLEFLERSDYVNFKKSFEKEMSQIFTETFIVESQTGNALYFGKL